MNREDLIAKRARAYALAELGKIGLNQTMWVTAPLFDSEDLQSAYLQGAKDAEDNPAWRMCEDEMPTDPHQPYWVYARCCGECRVAYLRENSNIFYDEGGEELSGVVAWLPLPKFKV